MEFNDVRLQYESLRDQIDGAVSQVLSGGRYILGPSVQAFEDEFSRYCSAANGIAVGSGTDALTIGLRALGVQAGDEVLVPAVSAAATAMAVVAGLFNGFLVSVLGIQPIVATLVLMTAGRGLADPASHARPHG